MKKIIGKANNSARKCKENNKNRFKTGLQLKLK